MAVLLTGAAGHIGSNIVRTLLEEGERVIGYDVTLPPSHSVVYPLLHKFPFVVRSVVDLPLMLNTIKQHKVQDVIHLAAIMIGAKERPAETVQVNVMGTVNVLEAGRILGLRRVICTSSFGAAGSTGKDQSRLIPETEYALPVSADEPIPPHASTKLMCEELDVHLTYIKDEVRGFVLAYRARMLPNCLYNISGGRLYSIREIAAAMRQVFPKVRIDVGPGLWRGMSATNPYTGPDRPASDISRARNDLDYEPRFADLDKALTDYRAWVDEGRY